MAGNEELIKKVTSGELLLADYQYIIAHPNILPELVSLRGLLKRRFPSVKLDTLGVHLAAMVQRFAEGISYKAVKDDLQQDFGLITANVGPLDMDAQQLQENLIALLKDVDSVRPKRTGKFITRVLLKCPPARECFKIDPFLYVSETFEKSSSKSESENVEMNDDDDRPLTINTSEDINRSTEKVAMATN